MLLPAYAVLAYCTLLHAATHAEARLSDPLQPLLLILIAGAGVRLVYPGAVQAPDTVHGEHRPRAGVCSHGL
jgi:hypothetical protein